MSDERDGADSVHVGWTLHRSLTSPLLMAGLPRGLGQLFVGATVAIVIGLHQVWFLLVAGGLYVALAALTAWDPYFVDVVRRSLDAQHRLDP